MLLWAPTLIAFMFLFFGPVFVLGLKIPPYLAFLIFLASLLGSYVNIPIAEVSSERPILSIERVEVFGISWYVPRLSLAKQKTLIVVNLGGAIIPTLVSLYLILFVSPLDPSPEISYLKILIATTIVALISKLNARVIPGFGIAAPALVAPLTASLASAFLFKAHSLSNPFVIAYVSGTLGTLIGADLLNLRKISKLGSAIVSIGGAGTFDGVYMAGVMATTLTFLLAL
ncbi:TPA: DUF1614 domain-containing protein [Candidatus Bathyarchaeota archaeon]|nr:DUF1614 domain-containing protein [Candidatus Bathyarchaeota archaeon]